MPQGTMDTKLKVGDVIEVFGWVMLKHLGAGRYRVSKVEPRYGALAYSFTRPRGRKVLACHFVSNVDPWVRGSGDPDLNKIEVLR